MGHKQSCLKEKYVIYAEEIIVEIEWICILEHAKEDTKHRKKESPKKKGYHFLKNQEILELIIDKIAILLFLIRNRHPRKLN